MDEHAESRFHPYSNIACIWRCILHFIQCLICFVTPQKTRAIDLWWVKKWMNKRELSMSKKASGVKRAGGKNWTTTHWFLHLDLNWRSIKSSSSPVWAMFLKSGWVSTRMTILLFMQYKSCSIKSCHFFSKIQPNKLKFC